MRQSQSKDESLEMVSLLNELLDQPVLSSKSKGWNGIVIEYHHHPANELVCPPLSEHLITLNCGSPYRLVQQLEGQVYEGQVAKGEIILTPANHATQWYWDSKVDVLHLCFEPTFVAKVALEAVEVDAARVEVLNCFAGADLQIQHIGHLLQKELESEKLGNRLYAESLTNALAVHLIREYSSIEKTVRQYSGGLSKSKLQRAIGYIQEHLDQDLSLDEAIAWYTDKLGFKLKYRTPAIEGIELALMEKNELYIDLIHYPEPINLEPERKDPPFHLQITGLRNLVFFVDNIAVADAKLKEKGVDLMWESNFLPHLGTKVTAFRDLDGNLVAFWEKKDQILNYLRTARTES